MRPTRPVDAERASRYREIGAWRDRPVCHCLDRAVRESPDSTVVVDGAERATFAEFDRRATRLAAALHRRGVGRDDVVSFQPPNRVAAVVVFHAVMKLGADVAIVAGPDPRTGERGYAFVVLRPGGELDLDGVHRYLTGRKLAVQKIPESVFVVNALPRTPSGKVQKFALQDWLRDPAVARGETTVSARYER
jgi:non-ribosomal peptide synthetase component E (peptide arylation enzyme)